MERFPDLVVSALLDRAYRFAGGAECDWIELSGSVAVLVTILDRLRHCNVGIVGE